VTAITVAHRIDNVASQSHKRPVLAFQVQRYGCDIETTLNKGFLVLITLFILIGSDSLRAIHQDRERKSANNRRQCCCFEKIIASHGTAPLIRQ
jgi:hypothetical protein